MKKLLTIFCLFITISCESAADYRVFEVYQGGIKIDEVCIQVNSGVMWSPDNVYLKRTNIKCSCEKIKCK